MKWERHGSPSSHWTIALSDQWFLVILLLITVFHFWLSTYLPPAEDELYYWSWAQTLQGSYYDHPPMVAYLIRLSTSIFGNNLFGIRFFACVLGILTVLLISRLTPNRYLLGYCLLTPLFFLCSVLMTPDIPLVFFWVAYANWLVGLNRVFSSWSDDPVSRVYRQTPVPLLQWLAGGVLLGLGCLSKYSMALAIPCTLMVLVTRYRMRAWITGFVAHLIAAGVVGLPVAVYNFRHDFGPLQFQWSHAMNAFNFSMWRWLEFVGVQSLLVGALPFLIFPWVLLRARDLCSEPRLQVCFYFFMLPLTFFLFHATRSYTEANWPLISYLTFWPVAQYLVQRSSFRMAARSLVFVSFLAPLICTGFLLVHLFQPLKLVPIGKDRIAKLRSQYKLSQEVATKIDPEVKAGAALYTPNYQWTAYFRYQGLPAKQLFPGSRMSEYTVNVEALCAEKQVIAFLDATQGQPGVLNCFPRQERLAEYPLVVRGENHGLYQLVRFTR